MRSKLFGRLMSFTLSATVALTSGIPSLAYDGGGGDLPEEELEILDLEETEDEDLGSDFDVEFADIEVDEESELLATSADVDFYIDYTAVGGSVTSAYTVAINATGQNGTYDLTTHPGYTATAVGYGAITYSLAASTPATVAIATTNLTFTQDQDLPASVTVEATATPTDYTIHFDANAATYAGAAFKSDSTHTDLTNKNIDVDFIPYAGSVLDPPSGYAFAEWNTKADGTGESATGGTATALTEDMILDGAGTTITFYARYDTAVPDGVDKTMNIKKDNGAMAVNNFETANFTYGLETDANIVFTPFATPSGGAEASYTNVEWSVYAVKDATKAFGSTYSDNVYKANGRWNDDNLTKLSASDLATFSSTYGLTFVTAADNKTLTIRNDGPKKALVATPFVIEIVDKDNALNIGRREIALQIRDGNLTATPTTHDFNPTAAAVKMGYDVVAADTDTTLYKTPWVKAKEIKLESTNISKYALDDLEFVWVGADADAFDAVIEKNNTVYVNYPETITIKPKKNLSNKGDATTGNDGSISWTGNVADAPNGVAVAASHDGKYVATLYAKSKAFQTVQQIVTVEFTVGNNLAISGAIAHGGEEAEYVKCPSATPNNGDDYLTVTPAASTDLSVGGYCTRSGSSGSYSYTELTSGTGDGTTSYYIHKVNLGEIHIGETFRDMVITAKGGSGKIQFTKALDSFSADGLVGTPTESAEEATYRVSGKALNTTTPGTKTFTLQAHDADGNYSPIAAFQYEVVPADVVVAIGADEFEELEYGEDESVNQYEWHAAKGYTAANEARTLRITNKSEDAISVTTALTSIGTVQLALNPVAGAVAIASGETKEITITPFASATGSTVSTTCKLALTPTSGNSFDPTAIELKFVENANDFDVTKPSTDIAIDDGYVGEAYSYQFGVTKSDTVTGITWSVVGLKDGTGGTNYDSTVTPSHATNIAQELEKYGLSLNKNTGALTGTPKKKTPAGDLQLKVLAKATPSTATPLVGVTRTITLKVLPSEKAFKHTVNNVEATATKKVDLGKVAMDKLDTISQKFTVINSTRLDVANAKTTISAVTSADATTALSTTDFELVFDENDKNNNTILSGGYEIAAGDSREIGLKVKDTTAANWLIANAGKYEITIKTEDQISLAFNTFVIKLELVAVPLVSYSGTQAFTVGTEVKLTSSTGKYKVVTTDGGSDLAANYTFAWVDGSIAGLTLSPTGVVYGTPTEAGTFDVTVQATNKTDSSVKALFTHSITVAQSSTISLASTDFGFASSTAVANNNVLLLKGAVVGDAAATKGTINLSAATENAENVVITVEDADEDRDPTVAGEKANLIKFPENPYKGSSNYIGVDKSTFANIRTSGTENFSIVTKGSPAAGVYKVKITLKGTNTNKIVFYAIMVVVDKLAITKPSDFTTSIGATIGADKLNIAAVGGGYSQKIKWGEDGTKVTSGSTETTEYYVTTESGATKGTSGTTSSKTGLSLSTEGSTVGTTGKTATASGLINDIQGTMKVAGTFDVNLNAQIVAKEYDRSASAGALALNGTDAMNADQIIYLSDANIVNKTLAGVYPKQEGAKSSFKIVSTKSNDVSISNATGTAYGTIEGMKNGDTQVTFKGFTWDNVVTTYSNTAIPVVVTVANENTAVDMVAKAAVSATSSFEVVAPATATVPKGTPGATVTPGTATFTVRPKAGLAKGTYTDTLTISGDDFESVTFALSFTVQDNTYLATIDDGNADLTKRITYATDNVPSGKTVEIKNYVAGASAYNASLVIRNTGNTQISNVNAYEVKADGSKYPDASTETMLTLGVLPTVIAEKDAKTLTITAKKSVAGVYSTYVNVHFTEGTGASAAEVNVKIPVTYTVYDKDLTTIAVVPADDIELSASEGYAPADVAAKVTIQNTATTASSVFTGYSVAMNSTGTATGTNFSIATKAEKTDVAAGGSIVYTLVPNKGLEEGTYTDVITISGGNLKTAITKNVTFEVGASTSYTVKATNAVETYTNIGAKTATGLYNSLVYGLVARTTNTNPTITKAAASGTTGTDTQEVKIDFNDDGTADTTLKFYGDNSGGTGFLTGITKAEVVNNTVTVGSKSITLTTVDIANAKGNGATARKYYSTINFTFFGKVTFGTDDSNFTVQSAIDAEQTKVDNGTPSVTSFTNGTLYAENIEDLANDNVVVKVYRTINKEKKAFNQITAYVPYGTSLGSVFTNGKLPTAVAAKSSMNAWYESATGNVVTASKVIYAPLTTLSAAFHEHTYAPEAETNEKYVKWIWTKDEKGNLSAELHLYCTDEACPDRAASEIVVNDKSKVDGTIIKDADANAVNGDQPLEYKAPKKAPADCEHGAGFKYPAIAKVYTQTYTGYYIEDEVGDPLGHLYDLTVDPDILWTDKNEDGLMTADEVKVTRTCSRDAAHVKELTVVSIGEENKVAPTCTKAGSVVYTITYTDITATGATGSNVTKKYNNGTAIVLKAKGHSENLLAEVEGFDENTAKAYLTLTCPDCGEVLFEKKLVQFVEDPETGSYKYKALLSNGEEYIVSYTNHAHVWTGEWSWANDLSKATLTITCTEGVKVGGKPEVKEFSVPSEVTKKGAMYTYTVSYTYTWTEKGAAKTQTFTDSKQLIKSDDGEVVEDIEILDEGQGIYIEGLEEEYKYTGAPIKPVFNVIDASTGLVYLVPGVDYTVSYKDNKKIGSTATITIKGKGNYSGQTTSASFTIVDPKKGVEEDEVADLKGAKIILPKNVVYTYDGEAKYPEKFTLKIGKSAVEYTTTDGVTYTAASGDELEAVVTFSNNVNAGTARMLLTGKNNAKGVATTAAANFKISPAPLNETDFAATVDPTETEWAVKGATPSVELTWKGNALLAGRDFTVKYANNKKVGTATATVKGKGNFAGKTTIQKTFTVKAFDLESATIVSATAAAGKAAKSVKVTVLDAEGNEIPASKLAVAVYDGETAVTGKLVADKEYTIKATPKSAKVTELTGTTPGFDVKVGSDFSKASFKLVDKKYAAVYTGEPITFTDDEFNAIFTASIKVNKTAKAIKAGEDFEIVGYTNNIKKGTMTITLKGNEDAGLSGTKTVKVKIAPKPIKK